MGRRKREEGLENRAGAGDGALEPERRRWRGRAGRRRVLARGLERDEASAGGGRGNTGSSPAGESGCGGKAQGV